jgi:glycosyltransferase involved in cell wall biosynthesis
MESILKQDYSNIIEILISDGSSNDGTFAILQEYRLKDARIQLLLNAKKIQTAALNDCIRASKGEVIARIDAHAYYSKDYVSKCVKYLLETGSANVGGPCRYIRKEGYIPSLINLVIECPFGLGGAKFRQVNHEGFVDSVWPGVFWREIFGEVGLFKEEFVRTEDMEFNRRLRDRGYKIFLTPQIKAYYSARNTLRELFYQNFNNGYGVVQTLMVARKITAIRHFVPVIFVFFLIVLGVLSFFSSIARLLLVFELGFYFLADFFFSIQISLRNSLKYLLVLPVTFLFLHLSYGIGSLAAIFLSKRE